jgi:hypothetical protein
MAKTKPAPDAPVDLGEFRQLSEKTLNKLIEKGRQAAEELDKVIRSQFELSDADGTLRVR